MKGVDMARFLRLENILDSQKYSAFLHIPELVVDGGSKGLHRGRKVHIGVHKGRYGVAMAPNL